MNHSNLDWTRLMSDHKSLQQLQPGGSEAGSKFGGPTSSLSFLRNGGSSDAMRMPSGLAERIDLTSLLQQAANGNGGNQQQTAVSSIAEYAALQQRIFLEEQARRDLISQALLQSQSAQGPTMGELLAKLGVYQGQQQSSMLSFHQPIKKTKSEEKTARSTPPLKKRRIVKTHQTSESVIKQSTAAATAPVMPLSYKDRKSTFPLPTKDGNQGIPIRILSLAKFEATWKHLETKASISDPTRKRKFVAEFFGRKIIQQEEERLYKKVHGLSNSNSQK